MKFVFLSVLIWLSFNTFACEVPRPEQHVSNDELIKRSKNIVLAKAISVKPGSRNGFVDYTFEVIRIIKGKTKSPFTVTEGWPPDQQDDEDYTHHTDKKFWQFNESRNWGRSSNDTDCEIYPNFKVGKIYLLFRDKPYHSKGFERINDLGNDEWLAYVLNQAKPNK